MLRKAYVLGVRRGLSDSRQLFSHASGTQEISTAPTEIKFSGLGIVCTTTVQKLGQGGTLQLCRECQLSLPSLHMPIMVLHLIYLHEKHYGTACSQTR